MGTKVFCPNCVRSCRIREEYLGKRVRCPGCQKVFLAEDVPAADPDDEPAPMDFHNEEAVVKPGKPINPFTGDAALPPVQADPSAFDFYGDDEPVAKKLSFDDGVDEPGATRKARAGQSPAETPRDKKWKRDDNPAPATAFGWDDDSGPPDKLPSDPAIPAPKRKRSPASSKPPVANGSPFSLGTPEENPSASSKGKKDVSVRGEDASRSQKQPTRKPAARSAQDEADFFGLQNLADSPARANDRQNHGPTVESAFAFFDQGDSNSTLPGNEEKTKPKKKKASNPWFHVRQSGFWDETRLFRVFVEDECLTFISAASGNEVGAMEAALRSESLDEFDKRIRNKVRDLDELSIDELLEKDETSFTWSAGKITEAAIDAPPPVKKNAAGSRSRSASLHLVHRSKGPVPFEFPIDGDVERAMDLLPDLFGDVLEVNVRWDKPSGRFVRK